MPAADARAAGPYTAVTAAAVTPLLIKARREMGFDIFKAPPRFNHLRISGNGTKEPLPANGLQKKKGIKPAWGLQLSRKHPKKT
jgi:hypothetical protein